MLKQVPSAKDRVQNRSASGRPSVTTAPSHPAHLLQRAQIAPQSLSPQDVLQLQRTVGNQAVIQRMLIGNASQDPIQLGKKTQKTNKQKKPRKKKKEIDKKRKYQEEVFDEEEIEEDNDRDQEINVNKMEEDEQPAEIEEDDEEEEIDPELLNGTPKERLEFNLQRDVQELEKRLTSLQEQINGIDQQISGGEQQKFIELKQKVQEIASKLPIQSEEAKLAINERVERIKQKQETVTKKTSEYRKFVKGMNEQPATTQSVPQETKRARRREAYNDSRNLSLSLADIKNSLKHEVDEAKTDLQTSLTEIAPHLATLEKQLFIYESKVVSMMNSQSNSKTAPMIPSISKEDLTTCIATLDLLVNQNLATAKDGSQANAFGKFSVILELAGDATHDFAAKPDTIAESDDQDQSNAMQVGIFGYGKAREKGISGARLHFAYHEKNADPWKLTREKEHQEKATRGQGKTRTHLSGTKVELGGAGSYKNEESRIAKFLKEKKMSEAFFSQLLMANSENEMRKLLAKGGVAYREKTNDEIVEFINGRRALLNLESARNRSSAPFHVLAMLGIQEGWEYPSEYQDDEEEPIAFGLRDYYSEDGILNPMSPGNAVAKGKTSNEKQQHQKAKMHRRISQLMILRSMLNQSKENFETLGSSPVDLLTKAVVAFIVNNNQSMLDQNKSNLKAAFLYLLQTRSTTGN